MIIAAVASTGSTAIHPGNTVPSSKVTAIATIPASPAQASRPVCRHRSHRAPERSRNATRAPTPSSHARVGREKNAHGSETPIMRMHAKNEAPVTTATSTITRRSRRRHSQKPIASNAGQSR